MGNIMGTKYSLISNENIPDIFQNQDYYIDRGYTKLVGTGLTYEEALISLTKKCKYNGLYPPTRHPTMTNRYCCGLENKINRKGIPYKLYHPVYFYKKALTCVAYAYYYPL